MINLISKLEDRISEDEMINMNSEVKIYKKTESGTAAEFLKKKFNIKTDVESSSLFDDLLRNTIDHSKLVLISLLSAIVFAIPLGIIAFKIKKIGNIILSIVGIVQTIPSLALLVFMIPLFGIGAEPAIAALFCIVFYR